MLHKISHQLLEQKHIGNVKGPWWFLQLWLTVYIVKVANSCPFTNNSFPIASFAEGATPILIRYTSLVEAASDILGAPLLASRLADLFKSFYHSFAPEVVIWCVYSEALDFETPLKFYFDAPPPLLMMIS
jgi:hypothetical protein